MWVANARQFGETRVHEWLERRPAVGSNTALLCGTAGLGPELAGQIKAKPARKGCREHRDDHLVKAHEVQRILDGRKRIVGADATRDRAPRCCAEQRESVVDHGLRGVRTVILWIDDAMQSPLRGRPAT